MQEAGLPMPTEGSVPRPLQEGLRRGLQETEVCVGRTFSPEVQRSSVLGGQQGFGKTRVDMTAEGHSGS